MLPAGQQIAPFVALNDEPVFKSDIVVGNKFQTARLNSVCTGLGKTRKRVDDIAGVVNGARIGKSLPGESTVLELDNVALKSHTGGFVHAVVIGTRQQH